MAEDSISKALRLIINRSLLHRKITGDWKSANVVPIFKKGSKGDKNNYRPVSLTSFVGKLSKTIVRDQLQMFLGENKVIYSSQHGFNKGESCLRNLIDFFDRILEWHDKGDSLGIIYLEFSKAFG